MAHSRKRSPHPPLALLRPVRTGVDIAPAAGGASELQPDVGHGRVRWPALHVEHALVPALGAGRHNGADAVLAHVGERHRLYDLAVAVTGSTRDRHVARVP